MAALALAVVGVLVVGLVAVAALFSLPDKGIGTRPTGTPTATPSTDTSPTPSVTASPSTPTPVRTASPSSGVLPVTVVARIPFPFPDSQTPPDQAVAVVDGSIWIADASQDHLVHIDIASNQVLATVEIDPSDLIAGDGSLWTISPVGMVPGPARLTVSRVDLSNNEVIATDFPEINAARLGSLWAISQDKGLAQIDPSTGNITQTWANIKGYDVEAGCGGLWIRTFTDTLTWFDPTTGTSGTPIDVIDGAGRVHETASGCYVVLGNPGDTGTGVQTGYVARIDETGIVSKSPAINERVHIAGDTVWTSTLAGVIQQIDPLTAAPIGNAWQLPTDERATNPKFADWRLMSAGNQLYLLTPSSVTHLDVATGR